MLRASLLALVSALLITPCVYAEGYLGEGIDVGIYKKVSEGSQQLKKQLVTKRAAAAEPRIKEEIAKQCGKGSVNILVNATFSPEELEQIAYGITDSFQKRIAPGTKLGTDAASCILGVLQADYQSMKKEVGEQQKTLNSIGSFGVYADGSTKNSSYDLMSDLETMHDIIFSKELPYSGNIGSSANSTANNLSNFLRAVGQNGLSALSDPLSFSDRLSFDLADAGWKLPNNTSSGAVPIPSFTPLCATGITAISGLDLSAFGIGATTPKNMDDQNDWDPKIALLESGADKPGDTLADAIDRVAMWAGGDGARFPCQSFFCINVDMTSYSQYLLWGKNHSIEGVLQKNLKLANLYSSLSFAQTKMTRYFFQMSLRDLDLSKMAHIGVQVNSLPAPILNLKGQNTPRGAPSESDDEKNMKEYVSNVFKDFWLDTKRENNLLEDLPKNLGIRHMENLSTDQVWSNLTPPKRYSSNYAYVKLSEKKNEYSNSFVDDLAEFEAFIHSFADNTYAFAGIIDKFYEIPNTR